MLNDFVGVGAFEISQAFFALALRTEEDLQLWSLGKVKRLGDGLHKHIQEEHPLVHKLRILVSILLLGWNRWNIQPWIPFK